MYRATCIPSYVDSLLLKKPIQHFLLTTLGKQATFYFRVEE